MQRYPIVQVNCVGRERVPLPIKCYRTNIWPNGHKNHVSYCQVLMSMWKRLEDHTGMLWVEGDIAIDPKHLREIELMYDCYPDAVVAVPYLIYPHPSEGQLPIWSNYGRSPLGNVVQYNILALPPKKPDYFSLGCTFLPRILLELVPTCANKWDFPYLSARLSELAYDHDIPCHATEKPAIHLHY